jgi:hypothetical protein
MRGDNGYKTNFSTMVLSGSIGLLVAAIWLVLSNWHGFKGAYLVDLTAMAEAQGEITHSSIHTSKWKNKVYYHYLIKYAFSVGGESYSSDKVAFNDNSSLNQASAQRVVNKYPVGKKITVYYNPQDPQFSVLEFDRNEDASLKLFFLISSVLIFLLSGGYWYFKRLTSAKTDAQ